MTVLVVNNYYEPKNLNKISQLLEAIKRNSDERCRVISYRDFREGFKVRDDISAVVLSGSSAHFTREDVERYRHKISFLKEVEIPVLGICHGHQLIGYAYGTEIKSYDRDILGFKEVEILEPDEIFRGWMREDKITVLESHKDYIAHLPKKFKLLATSRSCKIEAIKHKDKPIYGIQFHAEQYRDKERGINYFDGYKVIKNFFNSI